MIAADATPSAVLLQRKPPSVLVDGSNVAHGSDSKPLLARLVAALDALDNLGLHVVTIVDASLRHHIDKPDGLRQLVESKRVQQTPAGREADEFIVQLARRMNGRGESVYVVTNDLELEREGVNVFSRIAFLSVPTDDDREELLFSPPLESLVAQRVPLDG